MNSVTRKYMQLLSRIQVNDRGNLVNITWHAGNLPHADATHFIGNWAGNQEVLNIDTSNPNINADQVAAAMLLHIRYQCRVRLVQYIMYLSTKDSIQYSTNLVIVNSTAVGFVNVLGDPNEMGDISAPFGAGSDISLQTFTDYYEKLYSRYIATYRNKPTLLTDTICHSSCHDSCYGSRSRR